VKKEHKRRFRILRPFVAATFAMTVDGKTTTRNLSPVDFTSREDKLHLFRQRALADAVLIGHTSLKRDNVRLSIPADLQQARIKRKQTPAPFQTKAGSTVD
jgi:riboflavin biosynthesis pyrimidine reductase